MTDAQIETLARLAGVSVEWTDSEGVSRRVAPPTLRRILAALQLPCDTAQEAADSLHRMASRESKRPRALSGDAGQPIQLPRGFAVARGEILFESGAALSLCDIQGALPPITESGRHRLLADGAEVALLVAPERCWTIEDAVGDARVWGSAAQIYSTRRSGDCGIGDMTGVAILAQQLATAGACALALSPAHALSGGERSAFSPYSPSSRLFFNPLYADPTVIFGPVQSGEILLRVDMSDECQAIEGSPMIDWPRAGALKMRWLRSLFENFKQLTTPQDAQSFADFRRAGGARLERHARFEAQHAGRCDDESVRFPRRESSLRAESASDPGSIEFHLFLQWITARSHEFAQRSALASGMRIGLVSDLAVGVNPAGSDAWSNKEAMLTGVQVGAPPDLFNREGQNWGLTTYSPIALGESACEPFAASLAAAMGYAGGVRIDHVMGLRRLWLIPDGASASEGAYVSYPFDDLMRAAALESQKRRAIVIAEDLGTVPEGFRAALAARGVAGMNVLWFERDGDRFSAPSDWPDNGVAMTTTHDLPTLAGWWSGQDLVTRDALGLDSGEDAADMRDGDRTLLWRQIRALDPGAGEQPVPSAPQAFVDRAIDFVGATNSKLCLVPTEDLLGAADQPNMPGTIDQHPNWRRRMPCDAANFLSQPGVRARAAILSGRRPR